LEKFLARRQPPGRDGAAFAPFYALGQAVLALTQHALKHPAEAAAALAKARELSAEYEPDGSPDDPYDYNWDDWLRARLLLREATAALQSAPANETQPAAQGK
jgi:hypothetical protein